MALPHGTTLQKEMEKRAQQKTSPTQPIPPTILRDVDIMQHIPTREVDQKLKDSSQNSTYSQQSQFQPQLFQPQQAIQNTTSQLQQAQFQVQPQAQTQPQLPFQSTQTPQLQQTQFQPQPQPPLQPTLQPQSQFQPQVQSQFQPQVQSQFQPQVQSQFQPQFQSQPQQVQPQVQSQVQPQVQLQPQFPTQVQPQNQPQSLQLQSQVQAPLQPQVQSQPQVQPQSQLSFQPQVPPQSHLQTPSAPQIQQSQQPPQQFHQPQQFPPQLQQKPQVQHKFQQPQSQPQPQPQQKIPPKLQSQRYQSNYDGSNVVGFPYRPKDDQQKGQHEMDRANQQTHPSLLSQTQIGQNKMSKGHNLSALLMEINPRFSLSPAAIEILIQMADDFLDHVVAQALKYAQHRDSDKLEIQDLQLCLAKNWGIEIPGFGPSLPILPPLERSEISAQIPNESKKAMKAVNKEKSVQKRKRTESEKTKGGSRGTGNKKQK